MRKAAWVFSAFKGADGVESVSGMGLMIGIKPEGPAGKIVSAAIEKGVLALTAKDRVRLLPALNIPMDALEQAVERSSGRVQRPDKPTFKASALAAEAFC